VCPHTPLYEVEGDGRHCVGSRYGDAISWNLSFTNYLNHSDWIAVDVTVVIRQSPRLICGISYFPDRSINLRSLTPWGCCRNISPKLLKLSVFLRTGYLRAGDEALRGYD
jgi:hypothetical protein